MIRLLFVDDHPVVASGLAARYQVSSGFEVVGTAATLRDAMSFVRPRQVDVAVVDVQLDTLLTPRQVGALAEHCRVVLFSARTAEAYVQQLLAAGGSAIVDKAAPLEELDAVLRDVHAGRLASTTRPAQASDPVARLSARELEVYRALARCQTPKEVAASLGIARSTVYCHIEQIRRRLGVETVQEIIARAYGELPSPRSEG